MLLNQVWQPLPGTRQAQIYPYLRKPDLLSSNSCIIRTKDQIILIDAGGLSAQTAELCRILNESHQENPRPILIYLTHCHIDHSLELSNHRRKLTSAAVWIAIQEEGANCLLEGNQKKTIAELYGIDFPSIQTDIRLLTRQDRMRGAPRRISLAPDVLLTLDTDIFETIPGHPLLRQTVSIGGGDDLQVYPAPGHSPDSICIRAGDILFTGDLLAAANPMVAGISGWHKDHLMETMHQVQSLLETLPIRFCYPGHGAVIPANKARDMLTRLQRKIYHMGDVPEMNEKRLFRVADFAMEIISEAEEVFSSIAGRLLYVAYRLEELGEEDAADRCRNTMNMDQIDSCLVDFRNLCHLLDIGELKKVKFAHSALYIVEKIKALFDTRSLSEILPQSLINRGSCILLDFIGIANGRRNLEEFIPTDLNSVAEDVVRAWHASTHLDASIIDLADDHEKYLAALVLRIGHEPVANRPILGFAAIDNMPLVSIAAGRLSDTLMDFLQWLKRSDPESIGISTDIEDSSPFITVTPKDWSPSSLMPQAEKKLLSFIRRFRMCGMILGEEDGAFGLTVADDNKVT